MSKILNIVTTILYNSQGEILLLKRANDAFKGGYGLPGGKVKDGEDIRDANVREHHEELGIRLKSNNFLGKFELLEPGHATVHVFYEELNSYKIIPDKKEIEEYGFYNIKDIKNLKLAPNHWTVIQRFFNKDLQHF